MMNRILEKIARLGGLFLDILFKSFESLQEKWAAVILFGGAFIVGLLHWGFFLDWVNNQFNIQDWHLHVGPYLDFLSQAIRSGQFPMHAESSYMVPSQYLARQNRPLSPQILLLYFLDPATYVLVNVYIFYSLNFIGLLLIRARYQLSFISFLALFLLFNLNGHIVAHMGVGHFEWVGYFLLPFYVLLVLKMLDGEKTGWRWLLSMSLLMLALVLQGAAHFFIYCMALLALLALFQPRFLSPILKAIVLSAFVSMVRILPPALLYAGGTGLKFLGGYTSAHQLLEVFISPDNQGYWEKTYYVGLVGFAFVFYYGVIRNWMMEERYRALYLPIMIMIVFSVGAIYLPFFNSHIPFLDSQRAPTRFVIVPLVFLMVYAGIQFQSFINQWNQNGWEKQVLVLFGGILMAYDLMVNSRIWSIQNYNSSKLMTDKIEVAVANYPDPAYTATLIIGFAFTIITLMILLFYADRERRESIL
jgi:hypothetical protein